MVHFSFEETDCFSMEASSSTKHHPWDVAAYITHEMCCVHHSWDVLCASLIRCCCVHHSWDVLCASLMRSCCVHHSWDVAVCITHEILLCASMRCFFVQNITHEFLLCTCRYGQSDLCVLLLNRGALVSGGIASATARKTPLEEALKYARSNFRYDNCGARECVCVYKGACLILG